MSLFSEIAEKGAAVGYPYLPTEGKYKVRVVDTKFIESSSKPSDRGTAKFVAMFDVLESDDHPETVGKTHQWVAAFKFPAALADYASYVAAALNVDPKSMRAPAGSEENEKVTEMLEKVARDGLTVGAELCIQTFTKITKASGKDFTVHRFSSAE